MDHYVFQSLVQDIKSRCISLNFLNEHNMRLRYLDDEDNWINLNNDDEPGFQEFWQSARTVPEREFKRMKVKAGVLGSPIRVSLLERILQTQMSSSMQVLLTYRRPLKHVQATVSTLEKVLLLETLLYRAQTPTGWIGCHYKLNRIKVVGFCMV